MKTTLTCKKLTLKPTTQERIQAKLDKLDKFFGNDANAKVMMKCENNRVTAELTIICGSMVYRAEDTQPDALDAFCNAFDNIVRRIRKQKTKLEKRMRPDAFADLPSLEEDEPVQDEYKIIKTKHFAVKPLSVQEAILQMEMIGHQFYMFRNEETNEINVVYARHDGHYGLIEPD